MDKENTDFWNLYIRLLGYNLSIRETNYLLWRFYNKKNTREIARLDGRRITPQGVNMVLERAYRKIRCGI